MLALLALAHGASPDDALRAELAKLAGTTIPASLFCVEHPDLAAPFTGQPTPVGVQMKGVGCRLKAVAVGGRLVAPDDALPASVPGWAGLSADARESAALAWTRQVLLAFDHPGPADTSSASSSGGVVTVDVPFLQRGKGGNVIHETPGAWTFAADGTVEKAERTGGPAHQTSLAMKLVGAKGVDPDAVNAAITTRGVLYHDCVHEAWADDPMIEDRTRVAWDIGGGKASNVTAKGEPPPGLLQCYANAVGQTPFPPDMAGHIEWTFAIVRAPYAGE